MSRIFFGLAVFAFLLLVANMGWGLYVGDYGGQARQFVTASRRLATLERSLTAPPETVTDARREVERLNATFQPARQRQVVHVWLGIASALVTMLVNAVAVTYFIGTSRWCREVVETYGLDLQLADASARLKRQTFPWALGGMLAILGVVALGALADPGANFSQSARWVTPHFFGAVLGTLLIGWSFLRQIVNIGHNYDVIEQILLRVEAIRAERGLEPSSPRS